ncbi:PXMP2/4 family protein 4-like [Hydractinia symbiolongicarpus]|uniref:PXMP2/4 family protein 4-like n=1 Tax=Hydractinia symbiolongicarpus TaxID=13093 RepID=UPI00254F3E1D|nr:PXMP2/4 family protein 4-like [Hydractinia symbiolongicarpus]
MILSTLRRTFQKYPLAANIVTFTSLISGADLACQAIEHKNLNRVDWTRLRNMATVGFVYYGPVYYYYYGFLDRKFPGKSPRSILLKLAIDQFLFTIPSLCIFYVGMGKLEHKPWHATKDELKRKLLPTYVTACMFWPAAQVINFAFVPPVLRVVYMSGASFIWLICLSYIKNQPQLPQILQKIEDLTSGTTKHKAVEK